MNLLTTIINELIQWLIPIVVSAIAAYVARKLVPAAIAFVDARLDESQRRFIKDAFEMAAHSTEAERIRVALAQGTFDALAYAIRIADDELNRYGIDLDQGAIRAGLLAELHKLRIFTDIEGDTEVSTIAAAVDQSADESTRGILPVPSGPPLNLILAQRKALMWL